MTPPLSEEMGGGRLVGLGGVLGEEEILHLLQGLEDVHIQLQKGLERKKKKTKQQQQQQQQEAG